MNIHPDLSDDDLSSAMSTETLLAHDLVPEGLPASSKGPAEQQIHHIEPCPTTPIDEYAETPNEISPSGILLRLLTSEVTLRCVLQSSKPHTHPVLHIP